MGRIQLSQSQYNKKTDLFFACCFLFSILSSLVVMGFKGTDIPKSFFYGFKPFLFIGSVIFLFKGFFRYWLEVKKGWKGSRLLAIGCWITAPVLFDIGIHIGKVQVRDIVLLIISGVVILGSIWVQWKSINEKNL